MNKAILYVFFIFSFPVLAAQPLIQREFTAGFTPYPVNSVITIASDGKVTATLKYPRSGKIENLSLATIDYQALEVIKEAVGSISKKELVDTNPEEPKCLDAPSLQYTLSKADGTSFPFYREHSCHEFTLSGDDGWSALKLKRLLDGFDSLIQQGFLD
ncbi:MAG: hypothetical protein IPL83_14490 [Bdellovibrionales bacterium]|nr:hypothetical protein [Bdellovibrionales bacterium]